MKQVKKGIVNLAIAAIVAAGGVLTAVPAHADHGNGRCDCEAYARWQVNRSGKWRQMAKALRLTKEQREQIRGIFEKHREGLAPQRKELRAGRDALRELMQADKPDEAAIRAQVGKVSATQAELAVLRAKMFAEVRAVLTPEQQKKFKAIREKRRGDCDKRGDRHGRSHGRPSHDDDAE